VGADRSSQDDFPWAWIVGAGVVAVLWWINTHNCANIGHRVYVGAYDPNGLDGDNDGWGCDRW
jgi:hypothetical protein